MEKKILEEIKQMIEMGPANKDRLQEFVSSTHPADLADILEQLEEEERKTLFSLLPTEVASDTLAETKESKQEGLIESLDDEALHEVFEELSDDDATDIVQELSEQQAERVMRVIGAEDLEDIQTLMKYGDDTAGGVMTGELVKVEMDLTAAEAIEQVRSQGRDIEYFFSVYVVDESNFLQGRISVTDLILADPQIPISAGVAALRYNQPEAAVSLLTPAATAFPDSAAIREGVRIKIPVLTIEDARGGGQ